MPQAEGSFESNIQHEIKYFKKELSNLDKRVDKVERSQDRLDQRFDTLNEKLNKIDENITWLKRTIVNAIFVAISTGIIGGAIALFYNLLQK
ncbi:hemolysin XhlA family protein [Bacillus paralicheniformis]|uniref:hemolysin XhlA family protein n=1 Tax=Bacillus paralicheniformis TaxID=1648923 RepID=UPI00203F3B17|nr:hemolysin XhlA family protein [Bacillus paralicheniformis]MCM3425570.1 hemolysin XhlA family protein [Bacillus paralicheniformis]